MLERSNCEKDVIKKELMEVWKQLIFMEIKVMVDVNEILFL